MCLVFAASGSNFERAWANLLGVSRNLDRSVVSVSAAMGVSALSRPYWEATIRDFLPEKRSWTERPLVKFR